MTTLLQLGVCEDKCKSYRKKTSSALYFRIYCCLLPGFAVVVREVVLPFRQGPGNCETGQSVRADRQYLWLLQDSIHIIVFLSPLFKNIICSPLNGVKKAVHNNLATAKRWPRPLNRGGR